MAKGQRKQKQELINKDEFEQMCNIQCTKEEICSIFGICDDTLISWCKSVYGSDFSTAYKKYSNGGKMSLRRTMFKQAEKNPTMAIWLSKQHLGMRDNVELEHSVDNGVLTDLLGAIKNAKETRTTKETK